MKKIYTSIFCTVFAISLLTGVAHASKTFGPTIDVNTSTPTIEDTLVSEATDIRENTREVIQEVDSGINPETFIQRTYDLHDVFGFASLIFVLIAIVVGWIHHTIKQREDPLRKWLK